ncbi:uracil-DNA glycosylase-like [Sycon ciliatum]|uniref:uracil-DNA glycosylase-like n=1 Tax=Sycon ciliatum TaxID=27933 RepID=UPI0020AAB916|eukprot:scpid71111/ scgid26668/ Uracil-DNA glycosylase
MPAKRKTTRLEEDPAAKKQKAADPAAACASAVATPSATSVDDFCLLDHLTDSTWKEWLAPEFGKPYFKEVETFLRQGYSSKQEIFPPQSLIFNALNTTPPDQVKVVLLGQDPYHDNGQAHGLSFSVQRGVAIPPSLRNIYQELSEDIDSFTKPQHGNLQHWAEQGVLLLNATLTVQAHKANSHSKIGWQKFTDAVIKTVNEKAEHSVVFLLWGGFAQKKASLVSARHCVIKTAHPSPLSVTKWRGCRCFSAVNDALSLAGRDPIDWKIPE